MVFILGYNILVELNLRQNNYLFTAITGELMKSRERFDPPRYSDATYEASTLPPSHHGRIFGGKILSNKNSYRKICRLREGLGGGEEVGLNVFFMMRCLAKMIS